MYIVCVTVHVKPGHEQDFAEAIHKNHLGTVKEPGALRFDVLQAEDDPAHFVLYEVYRDKQAFQAHQTTEHYLTWRDTVTDWMARRRQAVRCINLFPESKDEAWGSNS